MKLYHVAIGKHVLVRKFVPRVPESVHPREDIITPRICFAETIEGCLSAIGQTFYYPGTPEPLTVWEGDFDERYIISPEYLYSSGKVMDCLRTREWWVLYPITLTGKIVYLTYFEKTPYILPDENKKEEIIKYIQENAFLYRDEDLQFMRRCTVHDILYRLLADFDYMGLDADEVAEAVGLDSFQAYYNCKFENDAKQCESRQYGDARITGI